MTGILTYRQKHPRNGAI